MAAERGEALCQAAREGNIDAVRRYLEAGGDANLSNPATGRTLLHTACREGYAEVASLLLSNGANPAAMTLRHLTPLHLACHQGHLKVARLLLEAWAPVDDRDEAATAPLHLAAQKGDIDIIRLLLQCGADKDALDESGWTPVFFASWKGHAAAARMLLQAGANARVNGVHVGEQDQRYLLLLHECYRFVQVFDRRDLITPLHLACSWGQLEVAKVLLEFGADSSAKDCNGAFPDSVIGAGSPDVVDPACARELNDVVVGHRLRIKGASSSLECVVDSLRAKVSELEDQLARAERDRLEMMAYLSDENCTLMPAALKPECPVCQIEVKEAVLDPCRHLAACASCATSLESCPFCACPVRGYQLLESRQTYERILAIEDEGAGLKAQVERFSRRVRDLVAANGELKLNARRAKAEIAVLKAERKGLEERFLLRTPSPPPMPPVGDIPACSSGGNLGTAANPPGLVGGDGERVQDRCGITRPFASIGVADGGKSIGVDLVQHMGDVKNVGDVESRGGISSASIGLEESEAGVLNRALPSGGIDHSDESNNPIHAPERGQVTGDPGFENDCGIERAADNRDSRDLAVNTTGARSKPSEGVNLDFAPDVATISEQEHQHGEPAEPSDGAGCGEQVASASSTAQATCNALDDAPKLNVTRPVNGHDGHDGLSERIRPQHTGAHLTSDKMLLGGSMGGSGTSVVSTSLADHAVSARDSSRISTQSRRKRADTPNPGSKGVVKSNASLETDASGTKTSVCEAESVIWPSASSIAAIASSEDISDDEHDAQVKVQIPPREETCSDVRQPSSKRGQLGNKTHDINYFLNDSSSQSSSDSRSPGG